MAEPCKSRRRTNSPCSLYPALSAEHFSEHIRLQLCLLLKEIKLQDATVILSASRVKASSFVLSLVSPVLRYMICGQFKESSSREMNLDDVDEKSFLKLLYIACGDDQQMAESVEEMFALGALSERLQMSAVGRMVEDTLLKELSTKSCAEMLHRSEMCGLQRLRKECCTMLREEFDEVTRTEGFGGLSKQTLVDMLEEDELGILCEKDTFAAVMRWMTKNGEEEELLRKIRYGLMEERVLVSIATSAIHAAGLLKQLVAEALTKKGAQCAERIAWDGVDRLCGKWLVPRKALLPTANLPAGTLLGVKVLHWPYWVAIDRKGRVLVTDWYHHQILLFNTDGSVARRFGSRGAAAGQFEAPAGVAIDRRGRVVVADKMNHRVQVLNQDGSVARCFGSYGSAAGQLKSPDGVAVDREGRIVVADTGNDRIQVFEADGGAVCARQLGARQGAAAVQLSRPTGVAVDSAGRIAVADCENNRVLVLNADGSVAACLGSKGSGAGELRLPQGVAVDREGRYVVADCLNRRVVVFNLDGSVARVMGEGGSGVGPIRNPYGVAADGAGRVLVVEAASGGEPRVQVL